MLYFCLLEFTRVTLKKELNITWVTLTKELNMKSNFSVCFITELRNSCHFKPSWCTLLNFLLPVLHTLSKEALAHKRVFFPVELWTWEESRATDNENFPSLALHPLHMKRNCPLWKFSIYLFLFFFFFCHGWIILWLQMEPSAGKEALMCPRIYCRIPSAFSVFFFLLYL